jgi:hypothetical protein
MRNHNIASYAILRIAFPAGRDRSIHTFAKLRGHLILKDWRWVTGPRAPRGVHYLLRTRIDLYKRYERLID